MGRPAPLGVDTHVCESRHTQKFVVCVWVCVYLFVCLSYFCIFVCVWVCVYFLVCHCVSHCFVFLCVCGCVCIFLCVSHSFVFVCVGVFLFSFVCPIALYFCVCVYILGNQLDAHGLTGLSVEQLASLVQPEPSWTSLNQIRPNSTMPDLFG